MKKSTKQPSLLKRVSSYPIFRPVVKFARWKLNVITGGWKFWIKTLTSPTTAVSRFRSAPFHTKVGAVGFVLFDLLLIATIIALIFLFRDLPSPTKLSSSDSFAVSSKIFDRNGTLLYEIYADENRTPVLLEDLPDYLIDATIAIEDKSFYSHHGFDLLGMIRAASNTLLRQQLQGGSTITQQLVKTALLTPERTIQRKMKEAVLTLGVEIMYSKDEILEMYLNHVPYGGTSWGIEAAAQTFFNIPAKDLTIDQATFLAGLPQAPSRYSPYGNAPELGQQRHREVLRRMQEEGTLSQEELERIESNTLTFAPPRVEIKAPHFSLYVKSLLEDQYGSAFVERGGLRVTTTLDLDLHETAQASLSAEIDRLERFQVGNGAALVTKPNTGEVLVMIGSRNYFHATADGQVNVALRERQPGSSIKPINVVIGMQDKVITPASMLLDIPTCFRVVGQQLYCPRNYDFGFRGPVQTRFYLGNSYNIPQVKLIAMVGINRFIEKATEMGITTWNDPSRYGLSLSLGGGEVRMVDMAVAFGSMANQGVKTPLVSILKIEDVHGQVLHELDIEERLLVLEEMTADQSITERGEQKRVLNREPAYLTSHILLDNNARAGAFGTNSELVVRNQVVSVKTGTTNDLRDNWTIGYTPEFLTAVWVGNNDNSPMNNRVVSGVTGAAPIWNSIMTQVLLNQPPLWPEKPEGIVDRSICVTTGLLQNPEIGCETRTEFFWEGTVPTETESLQKEVWLVPSTGLPLKEGDPEEDLILENKLLVSDPFTTDYCLDCVRAVDEEGRVINERYIIDMQRLAFPNPLERESQESVE